MLGLDINFQFVLCNLVRTVSPLCLFQVLRRGWTLNWNLQTYGDTDPGLMPETFWVELLFQSPCFYFLLMHGLKVYLLNFMTVLLSLTSTKCLLLIFIQLKWTVLCLFA